MISQATYNKISDELYNSVQVARKVGFQKMKPTLDPKFIKLLIPTPYTKLVAPLVKHVFLNGPFFYMVTLTFKKHISDEMMIQYTNRLIHILNKKIFHTNYVIKDTFIEGFVFFEKHNSFILEDKYHIHMLVKGNEKYYKYDFLSEDGIFHNCARLVLDNKNRPVFSKKCINIKPYRDAGAIWYCFKNIQDRNIHCVKFIGKEGLSDNLL